MRGRVLCKWTRCTEGKTHSAHFRGFAIDRHLVRTQLSQAHYVRSAHRIMFRPLPIELVCDITQIAAHERVASAESLTNSVQLAMLSRDIHALAIPIICHTIFFHGTICGRLAALANGSTASGTLSTPRWTRQRLEGRGGDRLGLRHVHLA